MVRKTQRQWRQWRSTTWDIAGYSDVRSKNCKNCGDHCCWVAEHNKVSNPYIWYDSYDHDISTYRIFWQIFGPHKRLQLMHLFQATPAEASFSGQKKVISPRGWDHTHRIFLTGLDHQEQVFLLGAGWHNDGEDLSKTTHLQTTWRQRISLKRSCKTKTQIHCQHMNSYVFCLTGEFGPLFWHAFLDTQCHTKNLKLEIQPNGLAWLVSSHLRSPSSLLVAATFLHPWTKITRKFQNSHQKKRAIPKREELSNDHFQGQMSLFWWCTRQKN